MERVSQLIQSGVTQTEYEVVDTLSHSDSEIALRFWQQRPDDGLKIGRDIPSRAIAKLLSRLVIYEPLEDGKEFRVHLAGSGLRRRFGRDITGETVERLYGPAGAGVRRENIRAVCDSGAPRMARVIHTVGGLEVLKLELLHIPVIAPHGNQRWVLSFALYF